MKNVITLLAVSFLLLFSCNQPETSSTQLSATVTKDFINQQNGYSQAVVINSGSLKTIYVSGQVGTEGETFEDQLRSALENIEEQLEEVDATMKDIVKMNYYIVDYSPEKLQVLRDIRKDIIGDKNMPASTLVGVDALALERFKVEVDAVAVTLVTSE